MGFTRLGQTHSYLLAGGKGVEPLFTESESDLGKTDKKPRVRQARDFTARIEISEDRWPRIEKLGLEADMSQNPPPHFHLLIRKGLRDQFQALGGLFCSIPKFFSIQLQEKRCRRPFTLPSPPLTPNPGETGVSWFRGRKSEAPSLFGEYSEVAVCECTYKR
jgi:hypothetical protein